MSERLYFHDSHLLEFEARVVAAGVQDGRHVIELDRTAFYPTGGGQPHDIGTLDTWQVEEVQATDDDRVVHFVVAADPARAAEGGAPLPAVGTTLHGRVDAARRRDHLQQHTGQHILSQALVRAGKIETRSFHLGATTATIDVDARLSEAILARAIAIANDVVFSDRELRVHLVAADELDRFQIRRQTFHGARIRLIEIDGFDVSTCGGTHAHRTGEVGLIAVLGSERTKGLQRVEFACGGRALAQLEADRKIVAATARELSTSPDQVVPQLRRLVESEKAARKRARKLFEAGLDTTARELIATANAVGPTGRVRFVARQLDETTFEEAQLLARRVAAEPGLVVALAVAEEAGAKLVLARSADVELHAGEAIKALAAKLPARGGGSAQQAQAALPRADDAPRAFAALAEWLGTH